MYGMVNQAIKQMVTELLGQETWKNICKKIEISADDFEHFKQFDDKITLNLVVEICNVNNMQADVLLVEFGRYWIKFAQKSDYNSILSAFATSPFELINSLNNLHDRLELTFTNLNAPSFEIVEQNLNTLTVNYYSDRKEMPLEYFVKGLFIGIFEMFNESCNVDIIETLGDAKATYFIEKL